MFALCEAMKWSHLPVPGGIYAQDPELIDGFRHIFAARARHESEEQKKQERERKQRSPSRGRVRGPSRSR